MKQYLAWFYAFSKRFLQKKQMLLLLLIFPLLCLSIFCFYDANEPLLQVALYNDSHDSLADETISELEKLSDVIHFYETSSKKQLYTDVQNTTAECGYIFTENYTSSHLLDSSAWKNSIQVMESPRSMLTGTINELVFSSFFRLYSKELLQDYLTQEKVLKKASDIPDAQSDAEALFDIHCQDDSTISIEEQHTASAADAGSDSQKITSSFVTNACRGVLSVLILLAALCGAHNLHADRKHGLFLPLLAPRRHGMEWLEALVPATLIACTGYFGLLLLPEHQSFFKEASGLIAYVVAVSSAVSLACQWFHLEQCMQMLIPLLTLGAMLFAPVFLDASSYIRLLTIPKYLFLNTYYLEMMNKGGTEAILLSSITALLVLLQWLTARKQS